MILVWNGFNKLIGMAKNNMKIAIKSHYDTLAGNCFYAWTEHIYLVAAGLDRKRWPGPRKYEVRYNTKRIRNFERIRAIKYVWGPLKEFFTVQSNVRKAYRRQLARFVRKNFEAWRKTAGDSKRLRALTVDNWLAYARLMVTKPFHAWAGYVSGAKHKMYEHERLAQAHMRCKQRKILSEIMRRWRHQSRFGRIDGLYTRKMLIDSLGEQKNVSRRLEKLMGAQVIELEECRDKLEKEALVRGELENKLGNAGEEISKLIMIAHHGDQERKRLEAVIESMAMINPVQIKHLQEYQPWFKFKLRRIQKTNAPDDYNPLDENDALSGSLVDDDDNDNDGNDSNGNLLDDNGSIDTDGNNSLDKNNNDKIDKTLSSQEIANILDVPELVDDDRLLLLRTKWILARFYKDDGIQGDAIVEGGITKGLTYAEQQEQKEEQKRLIREQGSITDIDTGVLGDNEGGNDNKIDDNKIDDNKIDDNKIDDTKIDDNKIDDTGSLQSNSQKSFIVSVGDAKEHDHISMVSAMDDHSLVDEIKGTTINIKNNISAAQLMLSFAGFLRDGDTTGFTEDDIRDWTENVMDEIALRDHDAEAAYSLGLKGNETPHEIRIATQNASIQSHMAPHSWRSALIFLRTVFPSRGVLEPNDHEAGFFGRIQHMKSELESILMRSSDLYREGLPMIELDNYALELSKKHGNNDNNNYDNNNYDNNNYNNNDAHHHKDIPLSIYASNLPKQLEGLKNQEKY